MVAAVKFNTWVEKLAEGGTDLDAGNLKILLSNAAPNASTGSTTADITQIANGNGYTTGGLTVTPASSSQTGGAYTLVVNDVTAFITSSGTVGPFRYPVLADGTALIMYWDLGASITLNAGDTLNLDFAASLIAIT